MVEEKKITREDFVKYLKEKKNIKEDKIKEVWQEKKKEIQDAVDKLPEEEKKKISEEEIEKKVMRKVSLYFRKISIGSDEEVMIIPLGVGRPTDFGAMKQYEENRKIYENDPHRAVMEGYTSDKGIPLWRNSSIAKRNGTPIQIDTANNKNPYMKRNLYCLAKRSEDQIWKPGLMGLNGDLVTQNPPLIGKLYKTGAVISKATNETYAGERIIMYSGNSTEFKNDVDTPEPIMAMVEKYAKEIILPYSDIDKQARAEGSYNDFFVIRVSVIKSSETMPGASNNIIVTDPDDVMIDEEKQLTGWLAEDIPLNIVNEADDVYIIANMRTYMGKGESGVEEEKLQFEIFGYVTTDENLKTEENTPIVGNEGQQIVVEEEKIGDNEEKTETKGETEKVEEW